MPPRCSTTQGSIRPASLCRLIPLLRHRPLARPWKLLRSRFCLTVARKWRNTWLPRRHLVSIFLALTLSAKQVNFFDGRQRSTGVRGAAGNCGRITASVRSIPEVHIGIGTGEINLFRRQGQGRRKIETKCLRGNHVLRHFLATVRQNRERSNFQGLARDRKGVGEGKGVYMGRR